MPFCRFERHAGVYVPGDVAEFDPETVARHVAEGNGVEVVRDAAGNFTVPGAAAAPAPEPAPAPAVTTRRTRTAGGSGEET